MLCFTEEDSGVIMLHGSGEAASGPFTMILGLVSPVLGDPGTQQVVSNSESRVLSEVAVCPLRAQP